MKTPRIYYGSIAVFCIAALVIGTAGAATMTQQGTGNNLKEKGGQFGLENMLANLTEQGYDVSAISAAVTSGDYGTAHTLMEEFRTANPDAFPARGDGTGKGPMNGEANGERLTQLLSNLTEQGYDVSAISAAVTSGDYGTAHTLMEEFRTANPDAFPARGDGTGKGPMNGEANGERLTQLLSNLTEQGYDVSAISAAVTSGDYGTAHTLMEEFRTANPDAFPARGDGTGKGPMNGEANGERLTQLLSNLTEQGYDVSAISAAVTSGDYGTAHTLMEEFRTANPDAFPARGDRAGSGHMGRQGRVQNNS